MSEAKEPSAPMLLRCTLNELNISSGGMPEESGALEIRIDFTVKPIDIPDDPSLGGISTHLVVSNEEGFFYSMEASGEAVFLFPESMSKDERDSFLKGNGAKEAWISTRAMLDGITAHFQHGAVRLPPLDLLDIPDNKKQ